MRTSHFVLAAFVALATSFSLRAMAWRHHGWPGRGWHHRPYGGRWHQRFGSGFGPWGDDSPAADDRGPHPYFGPRQPTGPTPIPSPAPPADSVPGAR